MRDGKLLFREMSSHHIALISSLSHSPLSVINVEMVVYTNGIMVIGDRGIRVNKSLVPSSGTNKNHQ